MTCSQQGQALNGSASANGKGPDASADSASDDSSSDDSANIDSVNTDSASADTELQAALAELEQAKVGLPGGAIRGRVEGITAICRVVQLE